MAGEPENLGDLVGAEQVGGVDGGHEWTVDDSGLHVLRTVDLGQHGPIDREGNHNMTTTENPHAATRDGHVTHLEHLGALPSPEELIAPIVRGLFRLYESFDGRIEALGWLAEFGDTPEERSACLERLAEAVTCGREVIRLGQLHAGSMVLTDREREVSAMMATLLAGLIDDLDEADRELRGGAFYGILFDD